jgi:hypothetical protein
MIMGSGNIKNNPNNDNPNNDNGNKESISILKELFKQ